MKIFLLLSVAFAAAIVLSNLKKINDNADVLRKQIPPVPDISWDGMGYPTV